MVRLTVRRCVSEILLLGGSLAVLLSGSDLALGQTDLPEVLVKQPKPAPKTAAVVKRKVASRPAPRRRSARRLKPRRRRPPRARSPDAIAARTLAAKTETFDQARQNLSPRAGANSAEIGQAAIAAMPQGDNAPIDKVLLQTPGFSQDSAASGALHLRNEHANVQYRINACFCRRRRRFRPGHRQRPHRQYCGDRWRASRAIWPSYRRRRRYHTRARLRRRGRIGLYGGSLANSHRASNMAGPLATPIFRHRPLFKQQRRARNPTPSANPIHDHTNQGKLFGYVSTCSAMAGVSASSPERRSATIRFRTIRISRKSIRSPASKDIIRRS